MPYANLQSESVQRRIAEENAKTERKRKHDERQAFWAEYKRRLALRDERKEELRRIMGWSDVRGGLSLTDLLPPPHYGPTIAITGNKPAIRRGRPTNLSQKRQIVKTRKG